MKEISHENGLDEKISETVRIKCGSAKRTGQRCVEAYPKSLMGLVQPPCFC